jgi:fibronectin type 3 domain-containing protein
MPMDRRCRAIFGSRIPGSAVTASGLEYFVEASDGSSAGYFPVTAPVLPASLVGERLAAEPMPHSPASIGLSGRAISWSAAGADCFIYRIYRSPSSDFSPSIANYLCFVPREKTSFVDSENDFTDRPKHGTYYYRVTVVDKAGYESAATDPVALQY